MTTPMTPKPSAELLQEIREALDKIIEMAPDTLGWEMQVREALAALPQAVERETLEKCLARGNPIVDGENLIKHINEDGTVVVSLQRLDEYLSAGQAGMERETLEDLKRELMTEFTSVEWETFGGAHIAGATEGLEFVLDVIDQRLLAPPVDGEKKEEE